MHLKWNTTERQFEAELSRDNFQEDLEAAKAAGFKSNGPPAWVWYSIKAMPLKLLREKRPSVLTIDQSARVEYERLLPVEENNVRLKAELAVHKKALKKTLDREKKQPIGTSGKEYIDTEDLPPMPLFDNKYVPPLPPEILCFICAVPVYSYEYAEDTERPACLWCQKVVLDIDTI